MSSDDLKNLTISALISKLIGLAGDDKESQGLLKQINDIIKASGLGSESADLINRK